jgi:hypothetical protein
MTTFDERERGFEKKFVNDQEQEFRAAARRNRMLGEWAAGLMGLQNVEEYAAAVVKAPACTCARARCARRWTSSWRSRVVRFRLARSAGDIKAPPSAHLRIDRSKGGPARVLDARRPMFEIAV